MLFFLALILACQGDEMTGSSKHPAESTLPAGVWERLSEKTIFFGHQSVGQNILDGIVDLAAGLPQAALEIRKIENPLGYKAAPTLAHAWMGRNAEPDSKLDQFAEFMVNGVGGRADIAFFKFCYVDFNSGAISTALFQRYRKRLAEMKVAFPSTTFVHLTVPVVARPSGPKDFLKRLLGRSIKEPGAVLRRQEFNELMRQTYSGREPIFDLARVESTYSDGSRELVTIDGRPCEALVSAWTEDGGHLNAAGRRAVAARFLEYLSSLPR
jgi:hypothetical protein